MSSLYITEFYGLQAPPFRGEVTVAFVPPLVNQKITISGTSAQSAAFNAETKLVRVVADANCYLAFGTNPTATTSMMPINANEPEYFQLEAGASLKIAAIV